MQLAERTELINKLFEETLELGRGKGEAYSGEADSLSNFKRNAERLGLTKYQIWAVYAFKHLDTISNAIKFNPEHPIDKTEGLEGRIKDAIMYLAILHALLVEDEQR